MKEINQIVINNIIVLRKEHNLTQQQLAKKINFSDKAISRWENGEVMPDVSTLNALAEIYEVPITYFFEEHSQDIKQEQKNKSQATNKILLGIISILIVWTFASILFVYLQTLQNIVFWQAFVWAVPLSAVVAIYYNIKWVKNKIFSLVLWSILIWSTITAFYLQFIDLNIWLIYIIGLPVQATIIVRHFIR